MQLCWAGDKQVVPSKRPIETAHCIMCSVLEHVLHFACYIVEATFISESFQSSICLYRNDTHFCLYSSVSFSIIQSLFTLVRLFYKVVWSDDWICYGIFSPSRRPTDTQYLFSPSFVSLLLEGIWRGSSFSFQTDCWVLRS